ncbi:MAG: hypothetical protein ABIQ77_05205 [Anaerolineales bacterium]
MSKVLQNLYEQVCHPLNIWWAYKAAAARGKRYTPAAASFEYDLEKPDRNRVGTDYKEFGELLRKNLRVLL